MTCLYFRSLLDDLVDHELSPALEATVRDHLGVCSACREEYEQSARLKSLLSELTCPEPEPGYWQESAALIQARSAGSSRSIDLPSEIERRHQQRMSFYRSLAAVAASLMLFLGTLLIDSPWGNLVPATAEEETDKITLTATESRTMGGGYILEDEQALITRGLLLVSTPGMAINRSNLLATAGVERGR